MSDATKREFPSERFDAVYSRDTILHIKDKKALFQKMLVSVIGYNNWPHILFHCLQHRFKYERAFMDTKRNRRVVI